MLQRSVTSLSQLVSSQTEGVCLKLPFLIHTHRKSYQIHVPISANTHTSCCNNEFFRPSVRRNAYR
jgi:hypothetical protein